MRISHKVSCRIGERLTLRLPRGAGTVEARVARLGSGEAGLLFLDDEATMGTVRRVIAGLTGTPAMAA